MKMNINRDAIALLLIFASRFFNILLFYYVFVKNCFILYEIKLPGCTPGLDDKLALPFQVIREPGLLSVPNQGIPFQHRGAHQDILHFILQQILSGGESSFSDIQSPGHGHFLAVSVALVFHRAQETVAIPFISPF